MLGLVLAALVLVIFCTQDVRTDWRSLTADLVINLIANAIVAGAAFFSWYFLFYEPKEEQLSILAGNDIANEVIKATAMSDEFAYRGPSGLWNIRNNLPQCLRHRKDTKGRFEISYYIPFPQVITPDLDYVCDDAPEEFSRPYRFLQAEVLLSTLLLRLLWARYPKSAINIHWLNFFPNMRWDVCKSTAFITRRGEPAVAVSSQSGLYKSISEELMSYKTESTPLCVPDFPDIPLVGSDISDAALSDVLGRLKVLGCDFIEFNAGERATIVVLVSNVVRSWPAGNRR